MKVKFAYENALYRNADVIEHDLGDEWKKKIFEILITNVIASVYPQGAPNAETRSFNRVLFALDAAPKNATEIELDRADAEFLKLVVHHDKAKVMPAQSRVFCLIQDAIEEAFKVKAVE